MASFYNSERLIAAIKRNITTPSNQNTYSDLDILAFADEELSLGVLPAMMSLHEDYLLFKQDVPLEDSVSEYVIPYRAVGNKLYDLQFIDTNGNVLFMSRTTLADQPSFNGRYTLNSTYNYYVMNNKIGILPNIDGGVTGSLRFVYYMRASSLVKSSEIGVINNINRTTGEIAVNSLPASFSTNTPLDFYKIRSPHNILSIDLLPTSVNATAKTIVFNIADIPSELMVGDHIALAEQCAIPQIPSDLHSFLAQKTSERILMAQGDSEGLANAQKKTAEMEVRAGTIIDNRVDESPIKLVNRRGILQSGLISRLYRRRG